MNEFGHDFAPETWRCIYCNEPIRSFGAKMRCPGPDLEPPLPASPDGPDAPDDDAGERLMRAVREASST